MYSGIYISYIFPPWSSSLSCSLSFDEEDEDEDDDTEDEEDGLFFFFFMASYPMEEEEEDEWDEDEELLCESTEEDVRLFHRVFVSFFGLRLGPPSPTEIAEYPSSVSL